MICYRSAGAVLGASPLRPSRGPERPVPRTPSGGRTSAPFFLGGSHWRPPKPPCLVFFMVYLLPLRGSRGRRLGHRHWRFWAGFSPLFCLRIDIFHRRLGAFYLYIGAQILANVKYFSYLCTINKCFTCNITPLISSSYMNKFSCKFDGDSSVSPCSQVARQGVRPDARRAAAIVARKIENARRMMSAFGRPMKF